MIVFKRGMYPKNGHIFLACFVRCNLILMIISFSNVATQDKYGVRCAFLLIYPSTVGWSAIVTLLQPLAKKNNVWGISGRLVFGASVYFIWQERNNRLFKRGSRDPSKLFEHIFAMVRPKLMTVRFRNSDVVKHVFSIWKISEQHLVE